MLDTTSSEQQQRSAGAEPTPRELGLLTLLAREGATLTYSWGFYRLRLDGRCVGTVSSADSAALLADGWLRWGSITAAGRAALAAASSMAEPGTGEGG